ncbi:hypothetical protein ACQBAU_00040 [Propionibacteriaceae bacterium Y2011]|uniref:hypothetical protein n=1 Tax=Microlunatus sp. Y2014 TaxID=3418488 RepID=UPI003B48D737
MSPTQQRSRLERLIAVVATLAVVLVAGVVVQGANRIDANMLRHLVDVRMGEPSSLAGGQHVFTSIDVGRFLRTDEDRVESAGRYVVIEVTSIAGTEKVPFLRYFLEYDGRRYYELDATYVDIPPGFVGTRDILFEVPDEAVTEMVVTVVDVEFVHGRQRVLRWDPHLGRGTLADTAERSVMMGEPSREVAR